MRITRQVVDKIIGETVESRTQKNRNILSIYLTGSYLYDDYLLGGTADIDLIMIHIDQPETDREIIRLTDELHLDIAHHFHRDYRQPRKLRVDPWMGPAIFECKILHDPQHLMDFTQAAVRGQFDRIDFVSERAHTMLESARQSWLNRQLEGGGSEPADILSYLHSLEQAANSVAGITGHLLTERRFLRVFPERAAEVGRPGLYAGLMGLIGANDITQDQVRAWLPEWEQDYLAPGSASRPARLHLDRLPYYRQAILSLLDTDTPMAALWPLLWSWTRLSEINNSESGSIESWRTALTTLGLQGTELQTRIDALDAFLDNIEEAIEEWGHRTGMLG
jgi:hypothetical protein